MKRLVAAIANVLLGIVAIVGLWSCAATTPPTAREMQPVNYMEMSDRLVTSGQLTSAQIAAMNPFQYRIVINLAPADDTAGVQDEARHLSSLGIAYAAIPVELQKPEYRDFVLFSNILDAAENGRVWVHCRINHRASVFAFLYRVIHEDADPDIAYEKVTQVWVPTAPWLEFARETLARYNIDYEL